MAKISPNTKPGLEKSYAQALTERLGNWGYTASPDGTEPKPVTCEIRLVNLPPLGSNKGFNDPDIG